MTQTTIKVRKETRDRLKSIVRKLTAKADRDLTMDEALNMMIDIVERKSDG
jgi:predicted transcriptional regulator